MTTVIIAKGLKRRTAQVNHGGSFAAAMARAARRVVRSTAQRGGAMDSMKAWNWNKYWLAAHGQGVGTGDRISIRCAYGNRRRKILPLTTGDETEKIKRGIGMKKTHPAAGGQITSVTRKPGPQVVER